MTDHLLVFSDLHLAPPGLLNNFHSGPELAACLRARCRPGTLLVLNGDVFDFLQMEERPSRLVLADIPSLLASALARMRADERGREVLEALGNHLRAGGRCLLIPGNHDPELAHPEAVPLLRVALGLPPEDERLMLQVDSEPLVVQVGRWQVVIGHGHRGDGWNDIEPARVRGAALSGEAFLDFPPGSRLVLETINALKRERAPGSGVQRYAFIDLLKPEGFLMFVLLLWVAPRLTLAHLPGFGSHGAQAIGRSLRIRLRRGPFLGDARVEQPEGWADVLAGQIASVLTEDERGSPEMTLRGLEDWLAERAMPQPGMLSTPAAGGSFLGRLIHKLTHGFFDLRHLGDIDRQVVQAHLPEGAGPRILICGHTHAARQYALSDDRLYLNTGTWTDLMRFPTGPGDRDLMDWRERLLRNEVPRLQRLTYAEVTPEGGVLQWWRPDPVV